MDAARKPAVRSLVPFVNVANVPDSIAFYRKVGFEVRNAFVPAEESDPAWAWLESDRAHLMVARADAPVIAEQQAVLFYLYCDDGSGHPFRDRARRGRRGRDLLSLLRSTRGVPGARPGRLRPSWSPLPREGGADPLTAPLDFDAQVRTAIYAWIVEGTDAPTTGDLADVLERPPEDIRESYGRLFRKRVLFLEPDGETIRMAPPFSAVSTQHRVRVGDRVYFANCSWDALGIPAALHEPGEVFSRCEQTLEPIHLRVGRQGPDPEAVVAHFAVPAAKWWADLVYT